MGIMSDPRNVAHDKKVLQEKKHHAETKPAVTAKHIQPGKKPELVHPKEHEDPATERATAAAEETAAIEKAVEAHEERTEPHPHS